MAAQGQPKKANGPNGSANLGFEAKMWLAADELRGQVDAAEYKHIVLGLVFLKYISDAFEQLHFQLLKEHPDEAEDRDAYRAEEVFWVPTEARSSHLSANAKQPTIGKIVDDAMDAIELPSWSEKTAPSSFQRRWRWHT
jgi:type I restriction enzyme M protein